MMILGIPRNFQFHLMRVLCNGLTVKGSNVITLSAQARITLAICHSTERLPGFY